MHFRFRPRRQREITSSSLVGFVAGYPWLILGLWGLTLSLSALSLSFPLVIAHTLDTFHQSQEALYWSQVPLGLLLSVVAGMTLLNLGQTVLSAWVSECVAYDLRTMLTVRLAHQSAEFVERESPARLLTRFTNDVDAVKNVINGGFVALFSSLFLLMGSLFMLFTLSPSLTWLIASCVPFLIGVFVLVIFRLRTLFRANQENLEKVNSHIAQSVSAASLVRVLNATSQQVQDFTRLNERTWALAVKIVRNFAGLIPLVSLIMNLMVLLTLWFGGQEVMNDHLSLGQFSAFFSYTGLLLLPILSLAGATGILTQAFVSFKRVGEVLGTPITKREGQYQGKLVGHYTLKDVSLTLTVEDARKEVLKNVTCSLPAGKRIAIVGPVGAGKTQLLNVLTSLTEPSTGEITLDGMPLADWDIGSLTSQIGMVFQDSVLFSGSIRANLGDARLREEDIQRALATAQLWNYVASLPEGLESPLAERGQDLSGGQKQRLMLARALAHNPRLLFLDDFTARLDTRTAASVEWALRENYPNLMTIYVSQNLSIAQSADWVLLMMEGELLAQGTHKDLLLSSWEYGQLFSSSQEISSHEVKR